MSEIYVSKCPYFVEEHEWWDITGNKQITKNCCDICLNDELNRFDYDEKCADNPNCYYKELQQLKAHCKQVDGTNKILYQEKCDLIKQNEELKKYIDRAGIVGIIKVLSCLDEIKEICKVNAINTCWNALNLCDKCDKKEECGLQSPLAKLDAISNITKQAKEGGE